MMKALVFAIAVVSITIAFALAYGFVIALMLTIEYLKERVSEDVKRNRNETL